MTTTTAQRNDHVRDCAAGMPARWVLRCLFWPCSPPDGFPCSDRSGALSPQLHMPSIWSPATTMAAASRAGSTPRSAWGPNASDLCDSGFLSPACRFDAGGTHGGAGAAFTSNDAPALFGSVPSQLHASRRRAPPAAHHVAVAPHAQLPPLPWPHVACCRPLSRPSWHVATPHASSVPHCRPSRA